MEDSQTSSTSWSGGITVNGVPLDKWAANARLEGRPAGRKRKEYKADLAERLGPIHLCVVSAIGNADNRKPYVVRDGVATINITGYLTNDAWWWDETEYAQIRDEVRMAMDDPEVRGVLLNIDSPGGEVLNAFETRDEVVAGRTKPMWAVAAPIAYSGGYLMATMAERIYAPPITGGVGSIGIYAMHADRSGALEKWGIKVSLISAGKGKTDGNPYEPLSKAARTDIEENVQRLYDEFVFRVSDARRADPDDVRALGAYLYTGREAVENGLADRTGSLEIAHADMVRFLNEPKNFTRMAATAAVQSHSKEAEIMAEKPTAVAEKPAPVVNIDQSIAKAKEDGKAELAKEYGEIRDLCTIAGKPELALEHIGKKPAEVRNALLDARADEDEKVSSQVTPETGLSGFKVEDGPVVKACERIAERMKGGNR